MAAFHDASDLLSQLLYAFLVSTSVLLSALLGSSQAQITLDGSLGPRGPLRGPHYTIPDTVGQIRGSNLFHSFGYFNLSQGESATFTGPNTITNILSRVTGGGRQVLMGLSGRRCRGRISICSILVEPCLARTRAWMLRGPFMSARRIICASPMARVFLHGCRTPVP